MVSRGLRVGLGLSLLSYLGLALLDGLYGALWSPILFESALDRLWFFALVALSLLLPAVMLGLCQGALGLAIGAGAARLARSNSPRRTDPFAGRLVALLCAPAMAAVCAQIFRGQQAQRIPGRDVLAVLLGVLGLAALSVLVPRVLAAARFTGSGGPRRRRRGLLFCAAFALLSILTYAADARILVRLYPWFHLSLLVLLLALSQLAALFFALSTSWLQRRWLHIAPLAPTAALLLGTIGAWGLLRLDRAAVLRAAALEHTLLSARVLRVHSWLHPHPSAALPFVDAGAVDPQAPASAGPALALGPRLADSDIVLITVDALRDDRLAASTMPIATRLAASGVRFARAYTQVPHTSFAVATLLTGKPVYALMQLGQDAAEHETLPMVLRKARYKTAAFYPPSVFYIEHERLRRLEESAYGFEYVKYEYINAHGRTRQVIDFFQSERPERAFVWVHYLEPHEPYEPHPGGPGRGASDRDRYDGEVRLIDQEIGALVAFLQAQRKRAIVILAADHGEEFGEHGGRYHGTTLYEEQVRVPLFFADLHAPPRLVPRRVSVPVGLMDVAPTILGLLDIAPSARMRGRDLGPLFLPGQSLSATAVYGEIGRKKMVVVGDDKLICDLSTSACALYDLAADPGERRSRLVEDGDKTRRLRAEMGRFLDEASRFEREQATTASDPALREALRRGRMGDRESAEGLRRMLATGLGGAEAAALYVGLCHTEGGAALCSEQAGRAALLLTAGGADEAARRWARIGLALGGDQAARREIAPLPTDDRLPATLRLSAALALGGAPAGGDDIDRLPLFAAALPAALSLDDPDRVRPLLVLLGESRDARALPVLLAHIDNVRSRADIAAALGALGQREALPALFALLTKDPYVPVRAAAATALGRLGGAAALSALAQAEKSEREAQVREAIGAARRPPGQAP